MGSTFNNKLQKVQLGMLADDVQTKFSGYDTSINSVNSQFTQKANQSDLLTQQSRIDSLVSTPNSSFYQKSTSGTTGALLVVSSGATTGQINLASVTPVATGYTPVAGDYVLLVYGVSSGSAELIDTRTGANGIIYTNAGEAVRAISKGNALLEGSITPSKTNFSFLTGSSKNIFDKNNSGISLCQGMYGTGVMYTDVTKFVSNYIPISSYGAGHFIRCGAIDSTITQYTMQFYDANKTRLSNGYGNVAIPDNAVFMRFTGDISNIDKIIVNIDTNLTTYYPYAYLDANKVYRSNGTSVETGVSGVETRASNLETRATGLETRVTTLESAGGMTSSEIVCYGDSLTYGEPHDSVTSYPTTLKTLLGNNYNVTNLGIPSFDTHQILGYIGSQPFLVDPFTMPSAPYGAGKVQINVKSNLGNSIYPLLSSVTLWNLFNPVTIDGVEGVLYRGSDNLMYFYFDPTTPNYNAANLGHIVSRPSIIQSNATKHQNATNIIWMGQNGGYTDNDDLVRQYKSAINKITSKKYLVLGLTTDTAANRSSLESRMVSEFGRNYINLRDYMVNYGLADAGITPTTADTTAIGNGQVPPSLLQSDGVHGTTAYYNIVANLVYKRGKELGYW